MLIDGNTVKQFLDEYQIDVTGVLHLGAHNCQELPFYQNMLGVNPNDIVWIDAMESKVVQSVEKGIPNVYHAVITDKDNDIVDFHIANNDGESSSVLELGPKHIHDYPGVHYIDTIQQYTMTIDTFFQRVGLTPEKYVFWNFDIQGAELLALKGAQNAIKYARFMYLEVNEEELYKDCAKVTEIDAFLGTYGFKRIYSTLGDPAGWGDALYVRV